MEGFPETPFETCAPDWNVVPGNLFPRWVQLRRTRDGGGKFHPQYRGNFVFCDLENLLGLYREITWGKAE